MSHRDDTLRIGNRNFNNASLTTLQIAGSLEAILYGLEGKKISFWWKRHVPVSHFAIEQTLLTGEGNVRCGSNISFTLDRSGDLARAVFGRAEFPGLGASDGHGKIVKDDLDDPHSVIQEPHWCKNAAFLLFDNVRFQMGNQTLDELSWFVNMILLSSRTSAGRRFVEMTMGYEDIATRIRMSRQRQVTYTPFDFWWTRETSTPLRLIAFAFHSAKICLSLTKTHSLICIPQGSSVSMSDVQVRPQYRHLLEDDVVSRDDDSNLEKLHDDSVSVCLLVEQVYLTDSERKHMANTPICDVIEHHQWEESALIQTVTSGRYGTNRDVRVNLRLHTPVKEIQCFIVRAEDADSGHQTEFLGVLNEVTELFEDPINSLSILVNNNEKIVLDPQYFRLVQPFQYHTALFPGFVYSYSFALDPESLRATGSLPAGKLDEFEIIANIKGHAFTENNTSVNFRVVASAINLVCHNGGMATRGWL